MVFGGVFLIGPGVFNVKSNLLVTGPPLTGDVGDPIISSIFDQAGSNITFAFPVAGELNYTFSKSKTQLFFGNGLEDILRLDVPIGIGIRKQLRDSSIISLKFISTPLTLKYWKDPYVENEAREKTELNFPGLRFRWSKIFKSGFDFTTTIRKYSFDEENSGDWLIQEGRLDSKLQPLINRDGYVYRIRLFYQFNLDQKNILRPAISYINDDHKGAAIANQGYALNLNYLHRTQKYIFDANLRFGKRFASADHPVYDDRIGSFRFGAAASLIVPVKIANSNRWNIWVTADYMLENSQITFFDANLAVIMGGLMYHFDRK
ncbi:DUF2860 family protein [Maribacter sp. 1_MG-2023]|uniref:DUF2860 family protein n=1 Tax=Maribacter sp. 1_MG-2023 TaxID=3062677 RepID=UPI0026E3A2E9|nr:DUF2860 family protein [Maribacter sp. 1_MG-2023]MDO6473747.1 DUF2860 family protein [Maribacter sp. 1_MG-2023]